MAMYSYFPSVQAHCLFCRASYSSRQPAAVCVAQSKAVRTAAQSAVSSVKDAVHFEKVVDETTEASWDMPAEEEQPAEPEVRSEEHPEE